MCAHTELSYLSDREPQGDACKAKQKKILKRGKACWFLRDTVFPVSQTTEGR